MRSTERYLLIVAWMTTTLAFVIIQRTKIDEDFSPIAIYVLGLLLLASLGHFLILAILPNSDEIIFPLVFMLTGIGLASIFRLRADLALRQLIWIFFGIVFMAGINRYYSWKKLQYWKYSAGAAGLSLLFLTATFGREVGGARRWLAIGGFQFEPVELVKVFLVVFLAGYLADARGLLTQTRRKFLGLNLAEFRYLGPVITMWLLFMFVLVAQKDLGAAFLFYGVFQAMLFVATGHLGYVFSGLLLALGGGMGAYSFFAHVRVRVDAWWNPWIRIDAGGYQITQSLFALGAGGLFGQGWGRGQAQAVPAVHTDFIFSSLAEEVGLFGVAALIFLFFLFLSRAMVIALQRENDFLQLLASGIGFVFALQVMVIIGGVIKLIPMTGITLPFISYGGSSLVSSYLLTGILLGISQGEG